MSGDAPVTSADAAARVIRSMFAAALAAVDPRAATAQNLRVAGGLLVTPIGSFPVGGRIVVAAMGKAAASMTRGVVDALGDAVDHGVVVTKDGHATTPLPGRFRVIESGHPIPDDRSLVAGEALLDLVSGLGPDDIVLALISGGGSALAEALRPPLTLDDLEAVTSLLLRSGATISELNAVRQPISRIKAGGLLRATRATVVPIVLSDVLGNDPRTIASGAAVPGPSPSEQAARALSVLEHRGLRDAVPAAVARLLDDVALGEADDAAPSPVAVAPLIIADNQLAVSAAERWATDRGLNVSRPAAWKDREGEASDLGSAFVRECVSAGEEIDVVLGGGEATVTLERAGDGGRNTEFALAAAIALDKSGNRRWAVASLATDGQDALTGMAGAIADGQTVALASTAGLDASRAIDDHDSCRVFRATGQLVATGPTYTNVNDLYIGVRVRDAARRDGDEA